MSNFVGINKQDDRQFKHHMTANEVIRHMESLRNEEQRNILMRFFKTGKGEYGEGDEFLGIKVPQTREVVKISKDLPLNEVSVLLQNIWHEVRLCGFLILVEKFEALTKKRIVIDEDSTKKRDEIVLFYLKYADFANNWDLVDLSAPKILGHWLMLPSFVEEKQTIVDELAKNGRLWRQRISMVCTLKPLQMGEAAWCLRYAEIHCQHPHDLMQKAVGWMLREMGKHVSMNLLRSFLQIHAATMPRTALRYAIEHMSPQEKQDWMHKRYE